MGAMRGHQKKPALQSERSRAWKEIRREHGPDSAELARLMGLSTRWVAAQEAAPVVPTADRRVERSSGSGLLTQVVQSGAIRAGCRSQSGL